jgi:hypothetical protein
LAKPSSLEYSHMGETAIRFENVTFLILRGAKSDACGASAACIRIKMTVNAGRLHRIN